MARFFSFWNEFSCQILEALAGCCHVDLVGRTFLMSTYEDPL